MPDQPIIYGTAMKIVRSGTLGDPQEADSIEDARNQVRQWRRHYVGVAISDRVDMVVIRMQEMPLPEEHGHITRETRDACGAGECDLSTIVRDGYSWEAPKPARMDEP